MERYSVGIPLVLVAASAIFGVTPQQKTRPAIGGTSLPRATTGAPVQRAAQPAHSPNVPVMEGPWKALDDFTAGLRPARNSPCVPQPAASAWSCAATLGPNVKFLIATVPDPQATNLALFFDRSIESLLWAGQDSHYQFERYWLPWRTIPEKDLPLLADRAAQEATAEHLASEPGLIVFRREGAEQSTLLVFVVGETPTFGINSSAFAKSIGYIHEISSRAGFSGENIPVGVTGPTFSGSLAPLARSLLSLYEHERTIRFHFVTGSITSLGAIEAFKALISPLTGEIDCPLPSVARVRFDTVIENDFEALSRFLKYLGSRNQEPSALALLTEGGTEYGGSRLFPPEEAADQRRLIIRYPRQIARLRNFADEPDKSGDAKGTGRLDEMNFTLKNSHEEGSSSDARDDVPQFASQQGPASQQSTLLTISSTLRREHVGYIGILATDVLDSLFLSRFVRESVPDARVFLLDSDLLFTREIATSPVLGLVSITTYPLFPRNQHWTATQPDGAVARRLPFSNAAAEGIYNASCALLDEACMIEYSSPVDKKAKQPPLWLTVLGRDGYWPVALLDDKSEPTSMLQRSGTSSEHLDFHPELTSAAWRILFWGTVLFSGLHCIYTFLLTVKPQEKEAAANGISGTRRGKEQRIKQNLLDSLEKIFPVYKDATGAYGPRIPYMIALTLVLTSVVGMLTLTLWPYWYSSHESVRTWAYTGVGGLCWLLLCGTLVTLWRSSLADRLANAKSVQQTISPLSMLALTAALLGTFVVLIANPHNGSGFFFAYRSQMLTSGVSPLAPILILTAGYFYFAWIHLQRLDLMRGRSSSGNANREPHNPLLKKRYSQIQRIDGAIENIFWSHRWTLALIVLFILELFYQPWNTIESVEPRGYDLLYFALIAVFYWMLAVCWSQFSAIWREFKKLLEMTETSPVRNGFSRLQKEISWLPLVSRIPERQFYISMRCRDTLAAIRNFGEKDLGDEDRESLRSLKTALAAELGRNGNVGQSRLDAFALAIGESSDVAPAVYSEFHDELDQVGEVILDEIEAHQWKRGDSDSVRREEEKDTERSVTPGKRLQILEEEFLALRLLIFMRYVYRHLRNLLGFIIAGFILSTISLQSYAFQGRHWIGIASVAIFVGLGIGVSMVFAQMDRDSILSRISDTKSNELGWTFVLRMAQFGILPLITLLAGQFPWFDRIFFSWVQPALSSLH